MIKKIFQAFVALVVLTLMVGVFGVGVLLIGAGLVNYAFGILGKMFIFLLLCMGFLIAVFGQARTPVKYKNMPWE